MPVLWRGNGLCHCTIGRPQTCREIVAILEHGSLMGNRGIRHDDSWRLVRMWQIRRWITCRLAFRGRHRRVMRPRSYIELFFLDEAIACATGHRSCRARSAATPTSALSSRLSCFKAA